MNAQFSLYQLLNKQVKQMIHGIGNDGQGNIHPLIMEEVEKSIIEIALRETNYNYFLAAKMLGIGRSTLYRKIEKFKIEQSWASTILCVNATPTIFQMSTTCMLLSNLQQQAQNTPHMA